MHKCSICSRIIFLVLLLPSFWLTAFPQNIDYLWPTDASTAMTSSFCEFRPRHYHAAIDIKTWNRTGYRIFAIQDGYIMRVRVSAFGYGKAIYLKLKDGNIVVYAHLQSFMPALEAYVDKIRQSREQYSVDLHLTPNQFQVRKDQVLGYTGRTGIGVPHLHFEIRNPQSKPINPLQFYPDKITDTISPRLYELALIPEDYRSLINFAQDTLLVNLQQRSNVTLQDTIQISGKVGLAVKSWDRANGATNLFSFYRANMWIDDSLVYSVQYDIFSYANTELIELDNNFSLWRKQIGIFHNFYRHPDNRLPHYLNTPANGGFLDSQKLTDGIHRLKVKLFDFWNNSAELDFYFRTGKPAQLSYDLNKTVDQNLFLRIQAPKKLENITVFKTKNSSGWSAVGLKDEPAVLDYKDNYYYSFSIPLDSAGNDKEFRIEGKDSSGMKTFPLYIYPEKKSSKQNDNQGFSVRRRKFERNWIALKADVFQNNPITFLNGLKEQINDMFWFPLGPYNYQLNIPVNELLSNPELLKSVKGSSIDDLEFCDGTKDLTLLTRDGLFTARFQPNSLYNQAIVYTSQVDSSTAMYAIKPPYRRVGNIYDLQPFDEPIKAGVQISLEAPDSLKNLRGLGMYYWDFKKGWLFIPSQINSAKLNFTARVTSLEKFTLIQDTIPPIISPLQSAPSGHISSQGGKISFTLKDEMSGIQREYQIVVKVNGQWHLFEYDPEEDTISLTLSHQEMSDAQLHIEAVDNVGNRTQRNFIIN